MPSIHSLSVFHSPCYQFFTSIGETLPCRRSAARRNAGNETSCRRIIHNSVLYCTVPKRGLGLMLKSDEQKLKSFQLRILGIRWYDFITNAEVVGRTHHENLVTQIRKRRLAVFGTAHVRLLPDTVPAHTALRLSIDARSGCRFDGSPQWKRMRGRPRDTWVRQVELEIAMTADTPWNTAADCAQEAKALICC